MPAMKTGRGRGSNPIMIVLVLGVMMMTGFVFIMMYSDNKLDDIDDES